jgi:uncharacterized protein YggE
MRTKNLIAIALLSVVVVLGACGTTSQATAGGAPVAGGNATGLAAQSIPPVYSSYTPGLTVVGTGTVEAQPDIVYLTLGVDLQADNAATVVTDASGRMDRILAALQAAGIAEEDIHTASYNLWVEQQYDPRTGERTGVLVYHIMHTVRVTLRDIEQVGTVLASAVEAGANSVNEVSFSVADPDSLASEARAQAIADAQQRAQEMAGALGVTLGKVVSVSESGGYTPTPVSYRGEGAVEYAAAVPLPAGSFSVRISVVVVYELP